MFFLISIKFYFSNQTEYLYKFNKFSSLIDLFNWIPSFLIFITFQKYLENKEKREFFTKYLVAGLIPVLLSCILQDWFKIYGPRETLGGLIIWFNKPLGINGGVTGLFSNQNYTGFWLSVNLPFLYFLVQRIKKFNHKKFILFIISILSINFLILTNSRNAILGFILSSVLILGTKKFLIVFILFLISISLFSSLNTLLPKLNFNIIEQFLNRGLINKINLNLNTAINLMELTRVKIWANTINFIFQKPLFGFGASTFPILYLSMQDNHIFSAQHSHNMPLQIAFEYGIPIAFFLTSFVIFLFCRAWHSIFKNNKNINLLNKCWIASCLVAITSHLTDLTYYDGKIGILIWILLTGLKCIMDNQREIVELN